jgi:aryl-alcohol dehydrogenase-like predicted oxidoreductase
MISTMDEMFMNGKRNSRHLQDRQVRLGPAGRGQPGSGPLRPDAMIADRRVVGIGLGTAPLAFGDGTAEDAAATVRAALDTGVGLIDTALAYTRPGIESYAEHVVAYALRGITGERPLVATKGGHWRDGDHFPVDGRPAALCAHCDISLRTLGTDRIDLYFLHHVDPAVPLADSVGALEQLRREGKIAAVGLSNVTIAQLDEALAVAPVDAVQNRLSYADPADLPTALACARRGLAYLAYAPLTAPSGPPLQAALLHIARRRQASVQRVMLAWLREQASNIVPLVGASRPASIRDSADLLALTPDDLTDLGAAIQGGNLRQCARLDLRFLSDVFRCQAVHDRRDDRPAST